MRKECVINNDSGINGNVNERQERGYVKESKGGVEELRGGKQ